MDIKLFVQSGSSNTRMVRLKSEETIIGRRNGCDIRIPSSRVSRRHCRLSYQGGCLLVEDLGSLNGTFINGKQVKSMQLVKPGDKLEVGPVNFLVQYQLSSHAMETLYTRLQLARDDELDNVPVMEVEEVEEVVMLEDDEVEELDLVEPVSTLQPQREESQENKNIPLAEFEEEDGPMVSPELLSAMADEEITHDMEGSEDEHLEFDFEEEWNAPQGADLRDFLSQLEDDKAN